MCPATLVLYEIAQARGRDAGRRGRDARGDRKAVVCRELTKKFEECLRGTLSSLSDELTGTTVKGEIVVLMARADGREC